MQGARRDVNPRAVSTVIQLAQGTAWRGRTGPNPTDRAKRGTKRHVLTEMGLYLPEGVTVRVWDTTAETRYLVLPRRPAGTEGWSEAQLAALVTYESMVGVSEVRVPGVS